jgi:hypothetical protein
VRRKGGSGNRGTPVTGEGSGLNVAPHCHFRDLLKLHSRYGPSDRSVALRRPLSRGSSPAGCPAEPLVSYRTNRQFSGGNLPPLMIRAFGAHGQEATSVDSATRAAVGGAGKAMRRHTDCDYESSRRHHRRFLLAQGLHQARIRVQMRVDKFWRCEGEPLVERHVSVVVAFEHFEKTQRGVAGVFDVVAHGEGNITDIVFFEIERACNAGKFLESVIRTLPLLVLIGGCAIIR